MTPYRVVGTRVLPALPAECPRRARGERCAVRVQGRRSRKAGPAFPLVVVVCRHHGGAFTLYPIGWTPFGRVAIACVGAGGEPVDSRSEIATATLLRAAVDAASGRLWPVASSRGPCRRTQGRRIELAARLLGLGPRLEERTREPVAEALGVPLLDLRDASASFAAQHTWRGRAAVVLAVHRRLGVHRRSIDALLRSGCIGDAWGRPSRWDPGGHGVGRLLPLF